MSNDMRQALQKAGIKTGGGRMQKKCKKCGKTLKPGSRFDTCFSCGKAKNKHSPTLPDGYLEKLQRGYFDSNGCLWEEFVTTTANAVAQSFGKGLKNHQLRRFYGHAKAAENRLRMTGDWSCVNIDIKKLKSFAAEAKGKGKIPSSFYEFIEGNIGAIKGQKDFEAFLEHFQAVVAFFTYNYPRN